MADKKITRIPNFSPAEKESLMMIAMRYATILEDKKTNRAGLEEKAQVWKKIEMEFNNTAPLLAFRSQEQLKRLYENRKKDLRKKMADYKKETYLTGGGPAPAEIVLDKVDNLLSQILNEKSVKGFCSEFDSDNLDQENILTMPLNEDFEPSLKKKKTNAKQALGQGSINNSEEDLRIFEFVPLESLETENIAPCDNLSVPEYQSGRCPPTALQKPINEKLLPNLEATTTSTTVNTPAGETGRNKTPRSDRRRPVGGLRTLTSSDVAEKYNILWDRRLVLVEKQVEQITESKHFAQEEHKQKLKNLKLAEQNLSLEKEEKLLKVELLKTEIKYKRLLINTGSTI